VTRLPSETVGDRMADIFRPASWRSCFGCGRLVAGANRCEDCQRAARKAYDATRPDHHALYQTPEWRRLSAEVRAGARRCRWCLKPTRRLVADHIVPVEQRPDLALDRSNLVPSCLPCNTRRGRNAKLPDLAA
jgi:5-methylcytosine-specific restriction endonuclease McrA